MMTKEKNAQHPLDFMASVEKRLQKGQNNNAIGFRATEKSQAPATEDMPAPGDIFKLRGYERALEVLRGYFDNYHKPLLNGEQRDKYFMEKLSKVRARYFEDI